MRCPHFSDTEGSIDKGVVISTTSNMAYEMTTLPGGGGVDDHEYEVIGGVRGNTHTATQGDEGLYEIPSSVTQYPPTPHLFLKPHPLVRMWVWLMKARILQEMHNIIISQ